jgi:hypothetical protein
VMIQKQTDVIRGMCHMSHGWLTLTQPLKEKHRAAEREIATREKQNKKAAKGGGGQPTESKKMSSTRVGCIKKLPLGEKATTQFPLP